MTQYRNIAIIDIGKTNAKLALVDLDVLREIAVLKTPNIVQQGPPYPHMDLDGLWGFITDGLARLHRGHGIDAISVTTHGASVVLLDSEGNPATPMLDYEFDGPDQWAAAYDVLRPSFAETGSPRLPLGLNVGAQLHWLLETQPGLRDRLARVVTYPQYWVGRLTGIWCNEVTSLGCHTDLWEPRTGRFSSLVDSLGLTGKMAPVRKAGDLIGTLSPEIAREVRLPVDAPVFCGIHDSNASLYPHLRAQEAPFSVLSTGTWVIAMAIGGTSPELDPARDTLINVNAFGDPVPSARFMGGREFEILTGGAVVEPSEQDIRTVLEGRLRLLPAVVQESGPFQGRASQWNTAPERLSPGEHAAVVSLYLAMMAATCLDMIGAAGPTLTEGPFARNRIFLDMLATTTGRDVLLPEGSATGTSIGAALLTQGSALAEQPASHPSPSGELSKQLIAYATHWRVALAERTEEKETC